MATKNDVTGDSIQSRSTSKKYRDNYDDIFGKKDKEDDPPLDDDEDTKCNLGLGHKCKRGYCNRCK